MNEFTLNLLLILQLLLLINLIIFCIKLIPEKHEDEIMTALVGPIIALFLITFIITYFSTNFVTC